MDPRIKEWQRQAQEAIARNPEAQDAINAKLQKLVSSIPEEWASKAQAAVDRGAPRDKVQERFKSLISDNGFQFPEGQEPDYSTLFEQGRGPSFKNVQAGRTSTAEPSYEQDSFEGESPEEYYDRKEREAKQSAKDTGVYAENLHREEARESLGTGGRLAADLGAVATNTGAGLVEGLGAVAGIGGATAGVLSNNPMASEALATQGFDMQRAAQGDADIIRNATPELSSENAQMGGQILSQLATFPVTGFQLGQDVLEEGGSLSEAEGALAKETVIQELGLASGKLGSQAKGLVPYLTRAGVQIPTNIALGAGSRALEGENYTKKDLILDAAMGAAGGIFRDAPAAKLETPPRYKGLYTPGESNFKSTGNEAFDAGQASVVDTIPIKKNEVVPEWKPEGTYESSKEWTPSGTYVEPAPKPVESKLMQDFESTKEVSPKELKAEIAQEGSVLLNALPAADGKIVRTGAPVHLIDKLNKGTLTTRDILEEGAKFTPSDPALKQEAANLVKYLKALSDRIGGEDVSFTRLDENNPAHAAIIKNDPNLQKGDFSAFYEPKSNRIYMKPQTNGFNTMVHEAAHGIASRMLYMGREGLLKGPAKTAFENMHRTFQDVIQPELTKRLQSLPEDSPLRKSREYGLTNIDEFYSEFFSNGVFRNSLKEMKLTPELLSGMDWVGKEWITKAKNLYDLVVKSISSVMAKAGIRSHADLGLAAKAESAYEAMFAHMDRLHNSLADSDASAMRQTSQRNTTQASMPPDLSFLGEQVPLRSMEGPEVDVNKGLRKPRNKIIAGLKAGVAGRGLEPKITLAKEGLSGAKQEFRTLETINANKGASLLGSLPKDVMHKAISHLSTIVEDRSAANVNTAKAFTELKAISPELAAMTKELATNIYKNSLAYADALEQSQAGKAIPDMKVLAFAKKIRENRNTYTPRTYASKEATQRKWKLAQTAKQKLGKKQLLSEQETNALNQLNSLESYIGDTIFGNEETLSKLRTSSLTATFNDLFGDNAHRLYKNMSKADRRAAMIAKIADYNASLGDRSQAISDMAAKIAEVGDTSNAVLKHYSNLKYGAGTLKALEDIPAPIRKFWGEVTDPLVKLIKASTVQGMQLAEVRTLNNLREAGMGELFTDQPGTVMKEELKGEGYGALRGLYTTPDIKRAIESITKFGTKPESLFEQVVQGEASPNLAISALAKTVVPIMKGFRAAKIATTVLRAGAWLRNAGGSVMQVTSNGNLNPKSYARGISAMSDLIGLSGKKRIGEDARLLVKLHLVEATQTADTYSPRAKEAMDKLLRLVEQEPSQVHTYLGDMKNKLGASSDVVKELYGAMDLWTKFANFFNEKDFWKGYNERKGIKMSEDELNNFVADRIKQTNITYSRSPKILQAVESVGATRFINYYYETFRTSGNNLGVGMKDVIKGAKEGDIGLATHGLARVSGTLASVGAANAFYYWAAKNTAALMGLTASNAGDNKELSEYMKDASWLDPQYTTLLKDEKSGDTYGFDASMIGPYDPVASVMVPLLKAIANPDKADEYSEEAAKSAVSFFTPNSLIVGLIKASRGSSPTISRTSPELYNTLLQKAVDSGLSQEQLNAALNISTPLVPGTLQDTAKGYYANASSSTKNILRSGIGAQKISPESDVKNYLSRRFSYELREAKNSYTKLIREPINVSEERLEEEFKSAMEAISKPYSSLEKAYKANMAMGKDEDKFLVSMLNNGVDKKVATMIIEGKMYPAALVYQDMKREAKEQLLAMPEGPEQEKAIARWEAKLESLSNIVYKYESLTLDDIEEGALDGE